MKYINKFYEKIYIIHWKPLKERKEYLSKKLEQLNFSHLVEWVDQYETEENLHGIKNVFKLNPRLLAVNMSHIYCYEEQIKHQYKNILILEDDIDFGELDILTYLDQVAFEFQQLDGDIAFLSTCCGLKVKKLKPPTLLYYDKNYVTRCMGAYVVNLRCAEKLIAMCTNYHAIDRVLNYSLPLINVRVLWSGLPIRQGSETGKYKSSFPLEIRDANGNYKNIS